MPWKKLRTIKQKRELKKHEWNRKYRGNYGRDEGRTTKRGKDQKQAMKGGEPGERLKT